MPSETTGWSKEPALRAAFIDESARRIESLADVAARLSTDDVDVSLVDALWREAHTLRGGAALVGLAALVDLAAEIEAILGGVRDGRLTVSDVLLDDLRDAIVELGEARERAAATPAATTAPGAAGPASSSVTVLVVDDDQLIRELVRRVLQREGYAAVTAGSAGDALGVLARGSIDLVVTDLAMPGDDGVALVHAIKSDPATKDVPVIVLSALPQSDDGTDLLASGADAVLSKLADDRTGLAGLTALVEHYTRGAPPR